MKKQEELSRQDKDGVSSELPTDFTISMLNTDTEGEHPFLTPDFSMFNSPTVPVFLPDSVSRPTMPTMAELYNQKTLTELFQSRSGRRCYARPDFDYFNQVIEKINSYMSKFSSNLKGNENRKSVIKSIAKTIYQYAGYAIDDINELERTIIDLDGFCRHRTFPTLNSMVDDRFERARIDLICKSFDTCCQQLKGYKDNIEPSTYGYLKSYVGWSSSHLTDYLQEVINDNEIEKYKGNLKLFTKDDVNQQFPNRRAYSDSSYVSVHSQKNQPLF